MQIFRTCNAEKELPPENCKLPTNCLGVFDYFVGLALKGLTSN